MHERVEATARAQGIEPPLAFHYVSMPKPWLKISDHDSLRDMHTRLSVNAIGLLVIDNLGPVSGEVEENSAQMADVMAGLRWLAEDTSATIVVIHHQPQR